MLSGNYTSLRAGYHIPNMIGNASYAWNFGGDYAYYGGVLVTLFAQGTTQYGSAVLAGGGTLSSIGGIGGAATLAGAGKLTALPQGFGTASLAGGGTLSATAGVAATAYSPGRAR